MMEIRCFTREGMALFASFLDSLAQPVSPDYPPEALSSDAATKSLPVRVDASPALKVGNRFELARYLVDLLQPLRDSHRDLADDPALWSWLAFAWFRDLCPLDSQGRHKPGERARWILTTKGAGLRYLRHFLYGPYRVYLDSETPESCIALLSDPINSIGRLYYQLISRTDLVRSRAVMEATTRLYVSVR